jgi:hypothetical protein
MRLLIHRSTESKYQIGRIMRIFLGKASDDHETYDRGCGYREELIQGHWVDPDSGETANKQINRAVFLEYFANCPSCRSKSLSRTI